MTDILSKMSELVSLTTEVFAAAGQEIKSLRSENHDNFRYSGPGSYYIIDGEMKRIEDLISVMPLKWMPSNDGFMDTPEIASTAFGITYRVNDRSWSNNLGARGDAINRDSAKSAAQAHFAQCSLACLIFPHERP